MPAPYLPACYHVSHHEVMDSHSQTVKPDKPFFLYVALAIVSHYSARKVSKIHSSFKSLQSFKFKVC